MSDTDLLAIPEDADDAERYVVTAEDIGDRGESVELKPLKTTFADITTKLDQRVPIIPLWMRNADSRRTAMQAVVTLSWYYPALFTTRSPKYAAKAAFYAPAGLWKLSKRSWRWAYDMEAWGMRQHHITYKNTDEYKDLQHIADKHRKGRLPWFFLVLALIIAATLLIYFFAPTLWQIAALLVVVPILARHGRPIDKPILDRVTHGKRFVRLTAEMVREAVVAIGVPGVKEVSQLSFPFPGVHPDGPGWLARVNLPPGIEAVKVIEKRAGLSSALRLPIDQVWPGAGPAHAGQLDLWVGQLPASEMGQPTWALTLPTARTSVFEPNPIATDPRQRPISATLFENSFLVGGQPGSGKSYAARCLATIAMLDPTCELKIAEFKGTGDFIDMEHMCSTYVVGVDEEAFDRGADIIAWALSECEKRGKRIRKAKERGDAPLGKITPELAKKRDSGLHPVFILFDEIHELFMARPHAAEMAERVIRRGRALGVILVLATQIPDKKSVPPNITRCTTVRWCLAVLGQVENDMILGTGAHKRGLTATVYGGDGNRGWGVGIGQGVPAGAMRSYFPETEVTQAIVARATQLRGGLVVGDDVERAPKRDTLADVLRVFAFIGRPSLQWGQLAELMADHMPEYEGTTAAVVSMAVRDGGVKSKDVNIGKDPKTGKDDVKKGCYQADVLAAVEARELGSGSGSQGVLNAS